MPSGLGFYGDCMGAGFHPIPLLILSNPHKISNTKQDLHVLSIWWKGATDQNQNLFLGNDVC
jgi:hypothetical protein